MEFEIGFSWKYCVVSRIIYYLATIFENKQCSFKDLSFQFFQITKMDSEKMALLTSFLVDFLEYLRASEGDRLMHKKVSSAVERSENPGGGAGRGK